MAGTPPAFVNPGGGDSSGGGGGWPTEPPGGSTSDSITYYREKYGGTGSDASTFYGYGGGAGGGPPPSIDISAFLPNYTETDKGETRKKKSTPTVSEYISSSLSLKTTYKRPLYLRTNMLLLSQSTYLQQSTAV